MTEQEKSTYLIKVYGNKGSSQYKTYCENIFTNFNYGNTQTVMFTTTDGREVSLPPTQVVIEQELVK